MQVGPASSRPKTLNCFGKSIPQYMTVDPQYMCTVLSGDLSNMTAKTGFLSPLFHPFPPSSFPFFILSLLPLSPLLSFPSFILSLLHPFPSSSFPFFILSLLHPFPPSSFPSFILSLPPVHTEIGTPTGTHFFAVDSAEEREDWVESIRKSSVSQNDFSCLHCVGSSNTPVNVATDVRLSAELCLPIMLIISIVQ